MSERPPKSSDSYQPRHRRAFTQASTPSRIERGGSDELLAKALEQALKKAQEENELGYSVTHPLHTYPARMHPATACALVSVVRDNSPDIEVESGLLPVLLDPFCGSGTILVEARRGGLRAIGVDANPLAVLISRTKTWTRPRARRLEMRRVGHELSVAALREGKAARRADYQPAPLRMPEGIDPEARSEFLQDWFAPHVRRELEHLAGSIDVLRADDPELADVLTVVLSSILYKVSRRASDTDQNPVERRIGRGAAARLFRQRVDRLFRGLDELARSGPGPMGLVHGGDARNLRGLDMADGSAHVIVTSPPYAGTYDYADQHRLRMNFLGMSCDEFERAEMGSRRQFRTTGAMQRRARRRWHRALGSAFTEMARVLAPGGHIAIMLGDSVAGERPMWADETMSMAVPDNLQVVAWAWQERAKLGVRERQAFGDRPKRECIFILRHAG